MDYKKEVQRAKAVLTCRNEKIFPPSQSVPWGMWGCVTGAKETVKFFINSDRKAKVVTKVKYLWNDWIRNVGEGLHSDKREARQFVKSFADLYAPDKKQEIVDAFFGDVDVTFENEKYTIKYTYEVGPGIAEHMYVLTPK
ncbi:hypothetical protein [Oceanidesulfovibrio marinus]|uniref:Uncharacterized protein n=1 Tax=Oceanidesulfovibrio marinus TaxID=370038 RepID=A0ABX6NDX4_9BACT|nr:hypothetical protein [Oceanidesulfovibrio marinus]QJT07795.1 hypothetical protein E8L03_02120 [Oceanidesulfovibrio marinus]